MPSVGISYAILAGRKTGDRDKARRFLNSLPPGERRQRNRVEGRVRARLGASPVKMGRRPRKRWTT